MSNFGVHHRVAYHHLSAVDQAKVVRVARRIFEHCRSRNTRQVYGREGLGRSLKMEMESQGAECAAHKETGLPWNPGLGPNRQGDLGPGYQVRSTERFDGRLILHPEDDDAHFFLLVVGQFPYYEIMGWLRAGEGKQKQWWKTHDREGNKLRHPCFMVPANELKQIDSLPLPVGVQRKLDLGPDYFSLLPLTTTNPLGTSCL